MAEEKIRIAAKEMNGSLRIYRGRDVSEETQRELKKTIKERHGLNEDEWADVVH